ncbi:MAG: hypothetical protein AB7G44_01615 [Bacteroidia bacterium]
MIKYNLALALIICFLNTSAQSNLYDADLESLSDVESFLYLDLVIDDAANSLALPKWENNSIGVRACKKNNSMKKADVTHIALRMTANKFYTITYSQVYDSEDAYTNKAYVGFMERSYGETLNESLKLKSKQRLYPENNIYTESIELDNGIVLIIENRIYIAAIILPKAEPIFLNQYYYEDCGL